MRKDDMKGSHNDIQPTTDCDRAKHFLLHLLRESQSVGVLSCSEPDTSRTFLVTHEERRGTEWWLQAPTISKTLHKYRKQERRYMESLIHVPTLI